MVATIADALAQVKDGLPRMIEQHAQAFPNEHDQRSWRQRLLDPLTTTLLFTTQVLHGNTAMLRTAQRQKVPLDRISFIDAWRWLRDARDAREVIDLIVNPCRPGRVEPCVIKRRMKEYPLMKRPRDQLRQLLLSGRLAA